MVKIRPPELSTEVPLLQQGSTLVSYIYPSRSQDLVQVSLVDSAHDARMPVLS